MRRKRKFDRAAVELGRVLVGRGSVRCWVDYCGIAHKYQLVALAMDERAMGLSGLHRFDLPQPGWPKRFNQEVMSVLCWALPDMIGDERTPVHQFIMRVASMSRPGEEPLIPASDTPAEVTE